MATIAQYNVLFSVLTAASDALRIAGEKHASLKREWLLTEGNDARATRDAALAAIKPGSRGAPAAREAILATFVASEAAFCAPSGMPSAVKAHDDATKAMETFRASCADVAKLALGAFGRASIRTSDLTVTIGRPSAYCAKFQDDNKYSKSWHRSYGPATSYETRITVSPEWSETVNARHLAVVDGLPTLDTSAIDAPDGYEAFSALWVENGRGYDVSAVRGVIVRAGRETAHVTGGGADAVKKGVKLLQKRARVAWAVASANGVDLGAYGAVRVTLSDSRAVGNCDPGTRSWCARAGIDPAKGATVGEVLAALAGGAGVDAMALKACRHAVARVMAK